MIIGKMSCGCECIKLEQEYYIFRDCDRGDAISRPNKMQEPGKQFTPDADQKASWSSFWAGYARARNDQDSFRKIKQALK